MVKISKNSMEFSYLEFVSRFFSNRIKDTYYFKDFLKSNNNSTKQFSYKFSPLLVYIIIHQLSQKEPQNKTISCKMALKCTCKYTYTYRLNTHTHTDYTHTHTHTHTHYTHTPPRVITW